VSLSGIIHSWKSFTSKRGNAILGRQGAFWFREYYDRKIRDEEHFKNAVVYIHNNPVKARLCGVSTDWRFSSARRWLIEPNDAGGTPAFPGSK
jgi:REP element-mobilizing transposase RayT